MDEDKKHSNGEGSPAPGDSKELFPKPEILDSELPSETMNARPHRDSVPSLPETSIKETLIAMGFSPYRVDQAMKENGEENIDLLLDILSDPVPSLSKTSVRESLIRMGSSPSRVDEAIKDYGDDLDLVLDALSSDGTESSDSLDSMLERVFGHEDSSAPPNVSPGVSQEEESDDGSSFGTMEKTLLLLEMGFSENEISLAIDRLGSKANIQELAGSICEDQIAGHNLDKPKLSSMASSSSHSQSAKNHTKNISLDTASNSTNIISSTDYKGKRPIVEYDDDFPDTAYQRRPKYGDEPDTMDED